jgi:hypothetical protein
VVLRAPKARVLCPVRSACVVIHAASAGLPTRCAGLPKRLVVSRRASAIRISRSTHVAASHLPSPRLASSHLWTRSVKACSQLLLPPELRSM